MFTEEGRAEVERLLTNEQTELESLVAEQERLAGAIQKKRIRIEVLQELSGGTKSHTDHSRETMRRRARRALRQRKESRIERTQRCLEEAGMSLYVGEILKKIGEEDNEANRNSLSSQLMKYVKEGRMFERDDTQPPRYFGLKRDEEAAEATAPKTLEDLIGGTPQQRLRRVN